MIASAATATATAACFGSIPFSPSCTQSSNPNKLSLQIFSSKSNIFSIHNSIQPTPEVCTSKICECFDLYNELVPYGEAWAWQKSIVKEKKQLIDRKQECPDTLIVLQHYPVYTLGTASSEEYLNFDVDDAPYDIYRTERGGEVTYHGPGQLVMYPIINLRNHRMDLHWYLRALEEVVIRVLLSTFAFEATRIEGLTGVWVGMLSDLCVCC